MSHFENRIRELRPPQPKPQAAPLPPLPGLGSSDTNGHPFSSWEQVSGPQGTIRVVWMSDEAPGPDNPSLESLEFLRDYIQLRVDQRRRARPERPSEGHENARRD